MADENRNRTETLKVYRPWVGVVLSFFISGLSQFLTGKKLNGIGWFFGLLLLSVGCSWCLMSPLVPGDLPALILWLVSDVFWIVMLIKSYRPVPRFHGFGWICFIFLSLFLPIALYLGEQLFMRPFTTPTRSMSPTIQAQDEVTVEGYAYWFSKPQRGDIIVFETKGISEDQRELFHIPSDEFYAKRIVGIPGDILSIQNGRLCNHNEIISEPTGLAKLKFVAPIASPIYPIYLTNSLDTYKVPDGSYFLIGDNTTNSLDSRYFGAVDGSSIIGKVSKIYWPPNRVGRVQ